MAPNLTSKRWLVVDDDDPDVLALTARVLRSLPDREVVACDNPRQALEWFAAEPESIELLVTDFQMPELNGCELARRARVLAPHLRIL
jgi:two-component system cell cycle sensor histidine kinase/response regulator CckA